MAKGVSCVLPWLLQRTNTDSAVVVDFKGENYRITADARRRMGHRVVRLDPFGVCGGGSDSFNPLDHIDGQSEQMFDECRDLAEALVVRTGHEKDPHWNDKAEQNIGTILCAIAHFAEAGDKSLQAMRDVLANDAKREGVLQLMQSSDEFGGILSRLGHAASHSGKEESGGILSTVQRHTQWLDTPAAAACTKTSTFNPAELRKGRMTIYLVLPPEHARSQSALLRMWIGSLVRAVIRCGLSEKKKVHFICDEANSLGKMDQISDVLSIGRGYGIRLQLYYQDCGQLKKCWPDGADQTLLANTTQVFFGVNDQQTAEYVSNRLGENTIIVTSGGTSSGTSSNHTSGQQPSSSSGTSYNSSQNWNQQARKLLKPEEVTALDPRVAITFTPGVPPIMTRLIRYYEGDFTGSGGIGPVKAVADTFALFTVAAALAVMATGVFMEVNHVKGFEGVLRACQDAFDGGDGGFTFGDEGGAEAYVEGIKAMAPGLSLSKILGDIGEELRSPVEAGGTRRVAAAVCSTKTHLSCTRARDNSGRRTATRAAGKGGGSRERDEYVVGCGLIPAMPHRQATTLHGSRRYRTSPDFGKSDPMRSTEQNYDRAYSHPGFSGSTRRVNSLPPQLLKQAITVINP